MKKLLCAALMLLALTTTKAQSVEINGVDGRNFSGVKPIMTNTNGVVQGYYTYYIVEKKKKGIRTFEFSIIDKDVTKVTKTQIDLNSYSTLNNTVFNGKFFLISYNDTKNKKIVFNVIDLEGKIVKTNEIAIEKKRFIASKIYPAANGEGFYVVRPIKEKKEKGFTIEKITNTLDIEWSFDEKVEKGVLQVADLINSNDRFVIWKEQGKGLSKIIPEITCYDSKTGKKLFSRTGFDGENTILYNQLRIDEKGNTYAGGAYVKGEKYKSVNNTGVYALKISPEGKDIFYTTVNNKEKIQETLKAVSTGMSVGSKDKLWIEDLIIVDGEVIVISEMFRKTANMKPMKIQKTIDIISGKYVGNINYVDAQGKSSKVNFEIMDFILLKFTENGELKEIKPIKKDGYTTLTVYHPYVGLNGMSMASKMDQLGWFDYGFTTKDADGTSVMVCSSNASARRPEVTTYKLDESFTKSEIDLKKEAKINLEEGKVSYFKTLRNDNGKVALAYYQRKLKRITLNIEEL